MNFASLEEIARAVLYEGYILYPYRPSSTKNQQRWNFGTLYPVEWAEQQRPAEACRMVTEFLLQGGSQPKLSVRFRCLQFVASAEGQHWEPGIERWADQNDLELQPLCERPFAFDLLLQQPAEAPGGKALQGSASISAEKLHSGLFKLHLEVCNCTPVVDPGAQRRSDVLLQSMVSAHLLLGVEEGEFISLLDAPDQFRPAVASCQNRGAFPVLAGEPGQRRRMLVSPIILYDYPQIAPESAGDFFDGTEMDEMLALRVMTLTEKEKEEMRQGDEQARRILERTETLPPEHWMKVHGAIRGLRRVPERGPEEEPRGGQMNSHWDPLAEKDLPQSVTVFGVELRKGSRVRLWPQKTADIMDMALEGKVAVIEAIEQDFDDQVHLAVVVEDDPGREFGMLRQPGHRFFFSPQEVEPVEAASNGASS